MSRASRRSPTRVRKPDAGHRSPETVALLPGGDADRDPARGDAAGPLALLDRPAGLEGRPWRHPEDALGERRPFRTVKRGSPGFGSGGLPDPSSTPCAALMPPAPRRPLPPA